MNYNFVYHYSPYCYWAQEENLVERAKHMATQELAKLLIEKAECEYDPSTQSVRIKLEV